MPFDLTRQAVDLTSMTARLRELDTSTPARVSTPVTSAATTDSMRASSPDGNAPPSGRSVDGGHKRAYLAAGMLRSVAFHHFTKKYT